MLLISTSTLRVGWVKQWTAEHWDRISPYLDQALELPTSDREPWLLRLGESGTDPALVDGLRKLLAKHEANSVNQFLERSPLESGAQDSSHKGQSIGAYTLDELIGRGGMGSVWRAQRSDGHFEARVAIKILDRRGLGPKAAEQIRREASLLARLSHPNIARLFDAGFQEDGQPFLVLEYVEGERIDRYCNSRSLALAARLRLFLPVLDAVAHAHLQRIVHRDLKPSNILVTHEGVAKLLDFGVASLLPNSLGVVSATMQQEPLGMTLGYAAPEQIRGQPASPASDVYALGILLHILLTGRHPHGADSSPTELVQAALTLDAKPASESIDTAASRRWVRGELDCIIAKATHREESLRYTSAGDLAADIRNFLESRPLRARRRSPLYRAKLLAGRVAGWVPGSTDSQRRVRAVTLVAAVLLLAATGAAVWMSAWNTGHRSLVDEASPVIDQRSIVVLPFVDMSEKKDQEYFSDGLTEELIGRLAHANDLKVIARTSSFKFKGTNEDVRIIGRRLGVANLLEGSVRRSGSNIRVTAQLVDAQDGKFRWSQTFDRKADDIFLLQDEICAAVLAALKATLAELPPSSHAKGLNIDAYNEVLRGRYFRQKFSKEDSDRAIAALRRAIAIDPEDSSAWVELARTYNERGGNGWMAPMAAYAEARKAADKALAIDPNSANAHFALGALYSNYLHDFKADKAETKRAAELDPKLVATSMSGGMDAMIEGDPARAQNEFRRIASDDPLNETALSFFAYSLLASDRLTEAAQVARSLLELNPNFAGAHSLLGEILLAKHEPAAALEQMTQETDESSRQLGRADALWALGRHAEADRVLTQAQTKFGDSVAIGIAESYAARGDADTAFKWLEHASDNHEPEIIVLRSDPFLVNLRADPRFAALLTRLNLP